MQANGLRWGHAPSPLRGWGYPHPLAGASWTIEHVPRSRFWACLSTMWNLLHHAPSGRARCTNAARLLPERSDRTGRAGLQGCIGSAAVMCAHEHVGHIIRFGGR